MKGGRPLIFIHIPKTAGSSLTTALLLKYRRRHTYEVHRDCADEIRYLLSMTHEQRRSIRLLKGHMPFGVHEHLPGVPIYLTMLRNPVDRVVSHYHYVRSRPDHYLHHAVVGANLSLESYVAGGLSTELDNGQTRLLSGVGDSVPFGHCSREHLELAKKNLASSFAVVGIAERFDESLLLMQRTLGWRIPPVYLMRNVSQQKRGRQPIPARTVAVVERHNVHDAELYHHALKLFEDHVRQCVSQRDLNRFRTVNGLFQTFASPLARLMARGRLLARDPFPRAQ